MIYTPLEPMSFEQFVVAFNAFYYGLTPDEIDSWRYGQVLFNTICEHRPDIGEALRGSALDPFYASHVRAETWLYIASAW